MFGFGRPAQDKSVIAQIEKAFSPLLAVGLSATEARKCAEKIFDEAKAAFKAGADIYRSDAANDLLARGGFLQPRLAAGLTEENIREYWNRPLITIRCELRCKELMNFMAIDIAAQQGGDVLQAARDYRKNTPLYGEPSEWDLSKPANKGLTANDAPIYAEFLHRVERWRAHTPEMEFDRLIAHHTSYNAMVRSLVATKRL